MFNGFYPMHLIANEFSVLDENNKTVFPENSKILTSLPRSIDTGSFSYKDGRRMVVSDIGINSGCLAYLIDALWSNFKQHYQDIQKYKLWLRPIVKGSNYKEMWNTTEGTEETISCENYSLQSFYTFPEIYISSFDIPKLVRIWNAYVGITWILLDRDPLAIIRAKMIKPANKYKIIKMNNHAPILVFPHISSSVLFSPAITWFIYALAREALALGLENNSITANLPAEDEIAEIVNNHSLEGAIEVWSRGIRNLGVACTTTSYSSAFWGQSLATFEWLIQNGGIWGLGVNPVKNWMLNRTTIDSHCGTLVAWERTVDSLAHTHNTPGLTINDIAKIEENSTLKLEEIQK